MFFFSFIFISWRLIMLQYCSGFCHTLTWISHGFTCVKIHLFVDVFCSLSLLNCISLNEYYIIYSFFLLYHFCFYKESCNVHFCTYFLVQMCMSFSRIQIWERDCNQNFYFQCQKISPWDRMAVYALSGSVGILSKLFCQREEVGGWQILTW